MKKLIFFFAVVIGVLPINSAQTTLIPDNLIYVGELWSSVDTYDDHSDAEVGVNFSAEGITPSGYNMKLSFQLAYGSIERSGVDIFTRNGERPIFSLRECYFDAGSFRIGRQLFVNEEGIEFDFVLLNPFETHDLFRPFSALDADRALGDWGIEALFAGGKLGFIAKLAEPPTIARGDDDPWTRQLPIDLYYGGIKTYAGYSVGVWWNSTNGDVDYSIFLQHGSGNSPVEVDVSSFGEVRPIVDKQTAISGAIQKPLGGWNLRVGLAGYFQSSDYSNFIAGVVELERFWEFQDGSVIFLDLGFADVWETQSGDGVPELDLRRIYEGGTALMTAEYLIDDWTFSVKGAYNFEHKGSYIAPELNLSVTDTIDLSLKYEMIDGQSSGSILPKDPYSEHSQNDNVGLRVIFYF